MNNKGNVGGQVLTVFLLVLIISLIVGFTFLFTANLKSSIVTASAQSTGTVTNESGWINTTNYPLAYSGVAGFNSPTSFIMINGSSGTVLTSGNYTVTAQGIVLNASAANYNSVNISYTYNYPTNANGWNAINKTETAGVNVVAYVPLIILALIFGALLYLIIRMVAPFVGNIGGKSSQI